MTSVSIAIPSIPVPIDTPMAGTGIVLERPAIGMNAPSRPLLFSKFESLEDPEGESGHQEDWLKEIGHVEEEEVLKHMYLQLQSVVKEMMKLRETCKTMNEKCDVLEARCVAQEEELKAMKGNANSDAKEEVKESAKPKEHVAKTGVHVRFASSAVEEKAKVPACAKEASAKPQGKSTFSAIVSKTAPVSSHDGWHTVVSKKVKAEVMKFTAPRPSDEEKVVKLHFQVNRVSGVNTYQDSMRLAQSTLLAARVDGFVLATSMVGRSIMEVLVEEKNAEQVKQGMKKLIRAETYVSSDKIKKFEFVSPGVNIQEKAETRAAFLYARTNAKNVRECILRDHDVSRHEDIVRRSGELRLKWLSLRQEKYVSNV